MLIFGESIVELRTSKLINNSNYFTLNLLPVVRWEKGVCYRMWLLVTRIKNEYLFMVEKGQNIVL